MHSRPLGPPPPTPWEMPFYQGGPGHMNLIHPPLPFPGYPNGPARLQGPPCNKNGGGIYQPQEIPVMVGPGGCLPVGSDIPSDPRSSTIPGVLPTTEAVCRKYD